MLENMLKLIGRKVCVSKEKEYSIKGYLQYTGNYTFTVMGEFSLECWVHLSIEDVSRVDGTFIYLKVGI